MKNANRLKKESFVNNSKPSTCFVEAAALPFYASGITGVEIPAGARAVLVAPAHDGGHILTPIGDDQSVLNIRRDLMAHLSDYPHSDAFLQELRDCCDARLQARADARHGGHLIMPGAGKNEWRKLSRP